MKGLLFAIFFSIFSLSTTAQNIFRTACQGKLERLDSLLQDKPIDFLDHRGRSLLHWAVACKQKEVFDFLVKKGINITLEDNQQKTAMYVAVAYGNETYFDKLVALQPNTNWIKKHGSALLEKAVLNEDEKLVKKLIDNGININNKNDRGSTALEISKRINATAITELLISLGADKNLVRTIKANGAYFGQEPPGIVPKLFAPNFISTEQEEFGSVFNIAGTEFYYGAHINGKSEIKYSKMIGETWSTPETIFSHATYGYNDPFLSNNENRLYFISSSALDGLGAKKDIDIWYAEKQEQGWSKPINAGNNINTNRNEYYISFTNDDTMYFSSNGHAATDESNYDIYYAKQIHGEFQKPIALSDAINTTAYEADVFIAPDESYIIFCSTRKNGFGRGDLYISFKNADQKWTPAVNMGKEINTASYEYCPFVTKDGKYFFYTSNQDIYWVSTKLFQRYKK